MGTRGIGCFGWVVVLLLVGIGLANTHDLNASTGLYVDNSGFSFAPAVILAVILIFGLARSRPGQLTLSPLPQQEERKEEQKQEEKEIDINRATILGRAAGTIAVEDVQRQSGCYLLGIQGVGKSSLLEGMIYQDICKGQAVIVLDPHGDLIDHALAQLPDSRLKDVSLLSIEDTAYPFGVNLFSVPAGSNEIAQSQALDRVMHVFEKCFPETSRMLLEKYLGNIAPVFFAHAGVGYGMTDIPNFLSNEDFRQQLVSRARLFVKQFWLQDYAAMSPSVRRSETGSLATRLNRFMRSPIVGNIIGQTTTTIDFRKAIENKEIIFVKLPVKTLKDDAMLIGTMLVAQIHAAIFSFSDMRLEDRPGFSLYVDEFQHFATSDFGEMFTEGRKFGARVTVAHQFRGQLPDYLASASMTARTKITFQTTQEDAPKMAPLYIQNIQMLRQEDIFPDPAKQLLTYGHADPGVDYFIKRYLRPVQMMARSNRIRLDHLKPTFWELNFEWHSPEVPNPIPLLNAFLYEVEKRKDPTLPIPIDVIWGFSGCGVLYWRVLKKMSAEMKQYLTTEAAIAPQNMQKTFSQLPGNTEQANVLIDVVRSLRVVMYCLAREPLGERKSQASTEVAQQIMNLPRRRALVKIGNDISEITTFDTPQSVAPTVLDRRRFLVVGQTRQKYCRSAADVEREIERRLGITPAGTKQNTQGQNTKPGTGAPNNAAAAPQGKDRFTELDDDV